AEGVLIPSVAGERAPVAHVEITAVAGFEAHAELDVDDCLTCGAFDEGGLARLDDSDFAAERCPADDFGDWNDLATTAAQVIIVQADAVADNVAGEVVSADWNPIAQFHFAHPAVTKRLVDQERRLQASVRVPQSLVDVSRRRVGAKLKRRNQIFF